jgi:hypothetical protein
MGRNRGKPNEGLSAYARHKDWERLSLLSGQVSGRLIPTGKTGHRRVGYLRNRRCFYSKQTRAFTGWLREQSKGLKSGIEHT